MVSTFHGIETAKRSLFAQMAGMNTTGHNIANASTPGYSRQVVGLIASRPLAMPGMYNQISPGQLGTGVEVNYIKRVRDQFLDQQYWNANRSLGDWEVQAGTLSKLETIFNEPSESGLTTVIDNFWKAWSEFSKDPENVTSRKIVRENALAMAEAFNETSKKITDMQADLTQGIAVNADHINTLTTQVAQLNYEINRIEGFRDNANDLRDQRDLIIDELSRMANVTVVEEETGYRVTVGGLELVAGDAAVPVTPAQLETAYGSNGLNSGELFGIIKSRDGIVKDYLDQLNELANTIANGDVSITIPAGSVLPEGTVLNGITYSGTTRTLTADTTVTVKGLNGLHKLGYLFTSPAQAAGDFFSSKDGGPITAASFSVNNAIVQDPNKIASSLRVVAGTNGDEVVKGNNTLALLMSQLRERPFTFNAIASNNGITTGTVDDYYRAVMGQLGVQSREALRQQDNNQLLVDQVDSRRQSVSGVSLDEEMSNLIKLQHSYGAASRFMTTVDQNLDKIINSMGVVGR
ncbi:flagellar hook-associated protein FlgK [Paenibacillus sp. BR1-192]|uniref:flagellar hook-associated protein FlgK n=1 Tax=Paenibacillus sp. BR1-192 TaxID=3032287 RepID=UPI00240E1348|nr:flagellar hook-associated protein FlgK [Paenibacillus sp. BR1-192]WFB58175.1 flagellar hook-associated protein FlgK [Paenibacillus sp. BR1-192]